MMQAAFAGKSVALCCLYISSAALSAPVYLSCVISSGPSFAVGSPLTFTFDESTQEVLLGNGSPARAVIVTPTEISFLHLGPLNNGLVLISISRVDGRFSTKVATAAGNSPASGSCKLTDKTMF